MKTLSIFSRARIPAMLTAILHFGIVTSLFANPVNLGNDGEDDVIRASSAVKSFEVRKNKMGIHLSWKSVNATASPVFEIERSVSGSSFVKIATLKPGNKPDYQFTDKNIFQPAYYYRIKIVTRAGEAYFSETIHISAKTGKATVKHSSPLIPKIKSENESSAKSGASPGKGVYNLCIKSTSGETVIFTNELEMMMHADKAGIVSVNLSGLNGRIRFQRSFLAEAGYNHIELENLNTLPPGTYLLTVKTGKQVVTRKAKKQ